MKAKIYVVPAILTVCSLVVIWASLQLDTSPPMIVGAGMQPRAFPIFLMVLNLILVGVLTVQMTRSPPAPRDLEPYQTWLTMVLLGVFFLLTEWLDLFIAIPVVMFLMGLLWGERRWYAALATALLTPVVMFVLFDEVLQVRFPRGLLMNWYYG